MQKGSHHTKESKARISAKSAKAGGRRQTVFHEGHLKSPLNCPGCRNGVDGYGYAYYVRNKKRERQRSQTRRFNNRIQALDYLGGKCIDCGYNENIDGLQFDHLPVHGKPDRRALLMSRTWSIIQAELDKCELVCGTCHSIRTANRRAASSINPET